MPKKYIMPPLVLTVICTLVSAILIIVYNLTYVDTTGIITDKLQKGLNEIYGEHEYTMLKNEDGTVTVYDGITSVITDDQNHVVFEIVSNGYSKGGIHTLIGVSDSGIDGISFIELNETQDVGTKIRDDKSFIKQFLGVNSDEYQFDAISGATLSSKGMKSAVDTALKTYQEHKGEILNEQ